MDLNILRKPSSPTFKKLEELIIQKNPSFAESFPPSFLREMNTNPKYNKQFLKQIGNIISELQTIKTVRENRAKNMWYRKAMDLNDLNKDFALERENVIDAVEEENTKQKQISHGVHDAKAKRYACTYPRYDDG